METALPLLSELGPEGIMQAYVRLQENDPSCVMLLLKTFGRTGPARVMRRLDAVLTATDEELELAEKDPDLMARLEAKAAHVPFKEAFDRVMVFFGKYLEMFGITLASSEPPKEALVEKAPKKAKPRDGSRSGGC
jgi:hypothetical protein